MTLIYLIGGFSIGVGLLLSRKKEITYSLLVLFVILQWAFTVYAYKNLNSTHLEYFTFDSLGELLLIALSVVAVPALFHSHLYMIRRKESLPLQAIYYAGIVSLITAISAGYLANHLAVTWIFTEITTLCTSVLIYHHRNKLALEGTWKYVFICAVSITFVFIGILFLSLSLHHAGSSDMSFANLVANAKNLNPFWLRLAFLFIFTGFTAKLGLVPMFTAGVDAKDLAPAPAGALLASVLMNLGFVGVFRTYAILANTPLAKWASIVVGTAAFLSLFVATVYMIRVKNIKRMFAYSGIEHMGLVMLGVAAGGIGYYAAILHVFLHTFVKTSLFFQFSQIYRVFQNKSMYNVGNYFKYNPTGAIVLLFAFISATAIPPSGLFVSEFLIFRSLFEGHHILVLVLSLLLLSLIIWGFGKNIFKLLFIPPVNFDDSKVPIISPWESASQIVLLTAAVYLGLNPPAGFVQLINDSIALLP